MNFFNKNYVKRLISVLLVLVMIIGTMHFTILADAESADKNQRLSQLEAERNQLLAELDKLNEIIEGTSDNAYVITNLQLRMDEMRAELITASDETEVAIMEEAIAALEAEYEALTAAYIHLTSYNAARESILAQLADIDTEIQSLSTSSIMPASTVRVYFDLAGGTWAIGGSPDYRDFPLNTPIDEIMPQFPALAPGGVVARPIWTPPAGEIYLTESITVTASWVVDITFAANPYVSGDTDTIITIPLNTSLADNGILLPASPTPWHRWHEFVGWFNVSVPRSVIDDVADLPGPGNQFDENTNFGSSAMLHPRWLDVLEFEVITLHFNQEGGVGVAGGPRTHQYEFALLGDGTVLGIIESTYFPFWLNRFESGDPASPRLRSHNLLNGTIGGRGGFNLVTLQNGSHPGNWVYQDWFTEPDGQGFRPFVTGQELSSATAVSRIRYMHENGYTDPSTGFIELYASWFHRVHFHENPFAPSSQDDTTGVYRDIRRRDAGGTLATHGVTRYPAAGQWTSDPEVFGATLPSDPEPIPGRTFVGWYNLPIIDYDGETWINEHPQIPNPNGSGYINHPLITNTIAPNNVLVANNATNLIPVRFTENTPIHNSMIMFARWEVESAVELRFHSNGGTFQNGVTTIVRTPNPVSGRLEFHTPDTNRAQRTPPIPSRPGYVFMGWFESPNVTGQTVDAGSDSLIHQMWIWERTYSNSPPGSAYDYYARWLPAVRINIWADAPLPPNDVAAGVPTDFRYGVEGYSFRHLGQIFTRSTGGLGSAEVQRESDHSPINVPRISQTRPGGFITLVDQNRTRGGTISGIPAGNVSTGINSGIYSTAPNGGGTIFNMDTIVPAGSGPIDIYSIWTSAVTFNNNQTSAGLTEDTEEIHRVVINSGIQEDRILAGNWRAWARVMLTGGTALFLPETIPAPGVISLIDRPFVSIPGHVFRGWNTQADGQGDWFFATTPILGDQTVYAIWSNGAVFNPGLPGSGVPEYVIMPDDSRHYIIDPLDRERSIVVGDPIPNFPPDPVWPGNDFRLWVDINRNPHLPGMDVFGAIELFALWSGSVTFNANGGVLNAPSDAYQLVPELENPTPNFPGNPSRTGGWHFSEWNTEQDGSGDEFTNTSPVVMTRTIYAQWDGRVTFDLNGGNVGGNATVNPRYVREDVAFGEMPNAVRLGYDAPVWEIVGGLFDGIVVDATTIMNMGDVTVRAVWTRSVHAVTFVAGTNGSIHTADTGMTPVNVQWNTAVTEARIPRVVAAAGHQFSHWVSSNNASITLTPEQVAEYVINGATTFTAVFTAINQHQVSFNLQGGAGSFPNQTILHGETATRPATNPTRTGFGFVDWFTAATGDILFDFDTPITDNTVIYARWTVTNGGNPVSSLSFNKFANPAHGSHVVAGQVVTYTIRVSNSGDASASNVTIRDVIPTGMTLVPNSATPLPTISGNTLTWNISSIAAGQTVEVSFQVTVNPLPNGVFNRTFRNTAQVNGNNTNTVNLTMNGLVKHPSSMTAYVGDTISWTLHGFQNPTDSTVTNFAIIDRPGLGLNFQSGSIPAFNNGAGITYDIRYRVYGSNEWHTHATGINANAPFAFDLPQPGDLYYTHIGLFFGTVPAGFGLGNEIVYTFVVGDNAPNNVLVNDFFIVFNNIEQPGSSPDRPIVNQPGADGGTARDISIESIIPFNPAHHAYMVGDTNGMVRPNAGITRAEVATIFFRLITDDYRTQMWAQQNTFPDVQMSHWFNNAVSTMANAGVFTGMPDGTFQPQRAITRAEFAVAMTRFFEGLPMEGANMFPDIEGHWAAAEINAAARMGWITGFPNGNFAPNQAITRAEAAALINRILGRLPHTANDLLPGMVTWADNANTNAWYYLYIQEASNSNEFVMQADGIHKTWTELLNPRAWEVLERPNSTPTDIMGQYRTLDKTQPAAFLEIHRQMITGR